MILSRKRIFEGLIIVAGLLLFALFIHYDNAIRIFGFLGLILSAFAIHFLSRGTSLLNTTGLKSRNRELPVYLFIALIIGTGLGVLVRRTFDLTLFPSQITSIALIAPIIGITEELIFRGFIQGHVRPAGRLISILLATGGHTLYKIIVIATLPDPTLFDYQFLIIWTFIGGILFSILRELSGSIYPSALAHGCFDIILYGGFATLPFWAWS